MFTILTVNRKKRHCDREQRNLCFYVSKQMLKLRVKSTSTYSLSPSVVFVRK